MATRQRRDEKGRVLPLAPEEEHPDGRWKVLPIGVREAVRDRLKAHAKTQGLSVSEWARQVLIAALPPDGGDQK